MFYSVIGLQIGGGFGSNFKLKFPIARRSLQSDDAHAIEMLLMPMLYSGGLWLSGRALASGAGGPEFEPPPGHRYCGRQASLTLVVYSIHSFNVFLVLKSQPKALQSLLSLLIIIRTINKS